MPTRFGSPEYWLLYAKSDLALAGMEGREDVLLETLCFHCQQCVEKSIKAVLILRNIPFPYTHNITRLIDLVKQSDIPWLDKLNRAAALTDYAAAGRYPIHRELIQQEEYQEAFSLAKQVFAWAEQLIRQG